MALSRVDVNKGSIVDYLNPSKMASSAEAEVSRALLKMAEQAVNTGNLSASGKQLSAMTGKMNLHRGAARFADTAEKALSVKTRWAYDSMVSQIERLFNGGPAEQDLAFKGLAGLTKRAFEKRV